MDVQDVMERGIRCGCVELSYLTKVYSAVYNTYTVFLVTSKISTTKLTGHIDVTFNSIESNKKNNTK